MEGEGDLEAFARRTLFDSLSQQFCVLEAEEPKSSEDCVFVLDYGMKPGALDLEKQAILQSKAAQEVGLKNLIITQRLYFSGEQAAQVGSEPFVRDIVNPAIHQHQLHKREVVA